MRGGTGALSHLEAVHARALGVVLNKVSKRSVGASNYSYYGYDAYRETRRRPKTEQPADL